MTDKIYIFMRRDLKMRRGKEIAQACHAVIAIVLAGYPRALVDCPVITLKAQSAADLRKVRRIADAHGLPNFTVRDAGLTEVRRGTPTCIAVLGTPGGGQFEEWSLY